MIAGIQKLKLRRIFEVDMRQNERTNLFFINRKHGRFMNTLGKGETILLMNRRRTLMKFVSKTVEIVKSTKDVWKKGEKADVTSSLLLRIEHGSWSPMMLQNYANEVGIDLDGLPTFQQQLEAQKERKERRPERRAA